MSKVKRPVTPQEWKEVGEQIRNVREKKNLTQEQVAFGAGITASYFARIERGIERPLMNTLKSITSALGVKIADIVLF